MLSDLWSRKPGDAAGVDGPTVPGRGEFEGVAQFYDHLMRAVPYTEWVDYVEQILRRRMAHPRGCWTCAAARGRSGPRWRGAATRWWG
jgi:hypothetical protein